MTDETTKHFDDAPLCFMIKIYHQHKLVYSTELTTAVEIGRQRPGEPAPYCRVATTEGSRVIVATLDESSVSRRHALLKPLASGKIQVSNHSATSQIGMGSSGQLAAGESCELTLPVLLTLGDKVVRVEPGQLENLQLESLSQPTLPPGQSAEQSSLLSALLTGARDGAGTDRLVRWLQTSLQVLQSTASSADFLAKAAGAVVDIVALDAAAVLSWDGHDWKIDAFHTSGVAMAAADWAPSRTMLQRVRTERRTFRHVPGPQPDGPHSLEAVQALVAAPILNPQGEVIGAIYGDRRRTTQPNSRPEISELEAILVELLACGVAAGLARLEQERAALAARIRFEQFFTAELSRRLEAEPDLLTGREAEVTVLFCDIRGFSCVTERLGPSRTIAWINDVMNVLSDCVLAHHGVLVDYIGDELMAMWGAPDQRPEHAQLACRAAVQMLQQLPILNDRWNEKLGEPIDLGIGLNAGLAQVGNTGSQRKFKYGPLGNTVNLASRLQGATKHVKSKLLITGSTAAKLDSQFFTRRLCQARVVNIAQPVTLYELAADASADWLELKEQYEAALEAFENRNFLAATRLLGNLLQQHPNDGPTLVLLSRTVNSLADSGTEFDPVWELAGK